MTRSALGIGIYSIPEASRLTGIPSRSIRRWLWGYSYKKAGERRQAKPLWEPQHAVLDSSRALGFRDLMEIRFVEAFREKGVSLRTIRKALERAKVLWHRDYPLSSLEFRTDGKKIFAELAESSDEDRVLFELISGQQLFDFVLEDLYQGLRYEKGDLVEWRPLGKDHEVLLDPKRSFGRPIIDEGVPTDVLAAAHRAEKSYEAVAEWYEVSPTAVHDAVAFEESLAA